MPMLAISARFAPLLPSRAFMLVPPSVAPSPKKKTCLVVIETPTWMRSDVRGTLGGSVPAATWMVVGAR
jgi:hypothetical protein